VLGSSLFAQTERSRLQWFFIIFTLSGFHRVKNNSSYMYISARIFIVRSNTAEGRERVVKTGSIWNRKESEHGAFKGKQNIFNGRRL